MRSLSDAITRFAAAAAFGAATATAIAWPARAATPTFSPQPCPATAAGVTVPLSCGTVRVPENRRNPDSRTIDIAVIVARTTIKPKARDPILLLGGGPEGFLDAVIAALSSPTAPGLLGNRDLVALDYRGIGYSTPNLSCPAAPLPLNVSACVAALRAGGADLSGYTTQQVAADVDDVREALHLRSVNLWGTSYGSHVALAVDRDFHQGVRSMILDGPFALQTRQSASLLLERAAAVDTLIAGCEGDPACGQAFPNLHTRYKQAIQQLDAHPLTVDGTPLTGDQLAFTLWSAQTNIGALPLIPELMDEAARGTLTTLASLGPSMVDNNATAVAAQAQIACSDFDVPSDRPEVAGLIGLTPLITALVRQQDFAFRASCREWPYVRLGEGQREPLFSATPALIFNGQYDPTLPLPEAIRTARTLSDARIVTFPGYAHTALGNGACPVSIALEFFQSLAPRRIDISCTLSLPQPVWKTR